MDGPGCQEWPWWVPLWVEGVVCPFLEPGSAPHPHWHAGGSPGLRLSNCRVLFLAWFPEEKAAYVIVLSVSAFPPTSLLLTSFEPPVKFSRRDGELQDVTFPCKLAAGAPSSGGDGAGTGGK